MKMADRTTATPCVLHSFTPPAALVAACLAVALAPVARAQSVVAESTASANLRFEESLVAAGASPSAVAASTPLQWASIGLRPHFSYRYLYGDGIKSGPGRNEKTSVHSVSPGVLFELGTRWQLDYTATQTYYSSDAFRDRLEHSARLNGATGYGNLSLNFGYRFSDTAAPLAETAAQTRQRNHNVSLAAGYSLGNRTGLTSSVAYTRRTSSQTLSYSEWAFVEGIQYQFTPKVRGGLNAGFGTVDVDVGNDMRYFRPSAQLNWQPTDKLSLGVQAGREERRFKESGLGTRGRPTYSGSVAYRPLETTALVFTASRGTGVSYFRDFVTESRSWSVALQQRLLQRLSLGVTYSERKADYVATLAGLTAARSDDSNTFSVRLGTRFFERGNIGLTYQKTDYGSNQSAFVYDSTQFGVEIGYRF